MAARFKVGGLYAVTPDQSDSQLLARMVREALAGGAQLVQYRNKTADVALRLEQARALRDICLEYNIPLIINDHVDLALAINADGVHIGVEDMSIEAARERCGKRIMIGVSCYDNLQAALRAERGGADYVAFGSFFASSVKPHAVAAPLQLLTEAKNRLSVPVVAIGGITLENAAAVIAAGADATAVISAVFGVQDITLAARQFGHLFEKTA